MRNASLSGQLCRGRISSGRCRAKSYNGVAMLSREPAEVTHLSLPGFENDASRYVEIRLAGMVIGNLYLPNGNSGGTAGFDTKLQFLDALAARGKALLDAEEDFLFTGDFNVCPTDEDYAPGALSRMTPCFAPKAAPDGIACFGWA